MLIHSHPLFRAFFLLTCSRTLKCIFNRITLNSWPRWCFAALLKPPLTARETRGWRSGLLWIRLAFQRQSEDGGRSRQSMGQIFFALWFASTVFGHVYHVFISFTLNSVVFYFHLVFLPSISFLFHFCFWCLVGCEFIHLSNLLYISAITLQLFLVFACKFVYQFSLVFCYPVFYRLYTKIISIHSFRFLSCDWIEFIEQRYVVNMFNEFICKFRLLQTIYSIWCCHWVKLFQECRVPN